MIACSNVSITPYTLIDPLPVTNTNQAEFGPMPSSLLNNGPLTPLLRTLDYVFRIGLDTELVVS